MGKKLLQEYHVKCRRICRKIINFQLKNYLGVSIVLLVEIIFT